jgi:gluconate 2-dehydrogenase gamma chain
MEIHAPKTISRAASGPELLTRRTALKLVVVGGAGLAAGAGSSAVIGRLGRDAAGSPYVTLSPQEANLLIEICEQLIPADDTPGATDAGVIHYIDRQLAGVFAPHLPLYRAGLESFRRTCSELHGVSFADVPAPVKIDFLQRVEAGKVPASLWAGGSSADFFRLVLAHAMQDFYGSPRHGGNRGYASYRMLGVDYPQIVGRFRYRKGRSWR